MKKLWMEEYGRISPKIFDMLSMRILHPTHFIEVFKLCNGKILNGYTTDIKSLNFHLNATIFINAETIAIWYIKLK